MIEWLENQSPLVQAVLATCFTWAVTALGAAVVFLFRKVNQLFLDMMMGFAAGVMMAASFWSLLAPSIEMAQDSSLPAWAPAAIGFLLGGAFLFGLDKVIPHLHLHLPTDKAEGLNAKKMHRSILLVSAITLHNIPEGLAIGVAFGAAGHAMDAASFSGAVALAIGIGIQNFPEGVSVSVPLHRDGFSKWKSFVYGQFSGFVEPISAAIGVLAVTLMKPILPYALAFAAGAMIFVVVEELIPESQSNKNTDLATLSVLLGFVVMMILDVAFG
jgi:ZIP family zinc transporter